MSVCVWWGGGGADVVLWPFCLRDRGFGVAGFGRARRPRIGSGAAFCQDFGYFPALFPALLQICNASLQLPHPLAPIHAASTALSPLTWRDLCSLARLMWLDLCDNLAYGLNVFHPRLGRGVVRHDEPL